LSVKTNFLNRINMIALSGKSVKTCQAPQLKIFWFSEDPNQFYSPAVPSQTKGAFRDRHERWRRDAVDAAAL
jgi:hypothetical protein